MRKAIGLACVVLAIGGCGSSDGGSGGTCSWGGACGGVITGTWTYVSECVLGTFTSTSCPGEQISVNGRPSGSVTFASDGTATENVTTDVHETASFPASCLSGLSDCNAVADQLKAQFTVPAAVSCSGSVSTSCSCVIDATITSVGSGTYTVSGNAVTVTNSVGTATASTYCVKGSALTIDTPHGDGTESVGTFARAN